MLPARSENLSGKRARNPASSGLGPPVPKPLPGRVESVQREKPGKIPSFPQTGARTFRGATQTMFRTLLKSKIHRARVTHCELHYESSCAIDEDLLDAANLRENEQVHIWDVDNGERLVTYALRAPRGSGIISLNGSAARRAAVGDLVIIAAFAMVHEDKLDDAEPKLVFVDEKNRIKPRPPFVGHTEETVAAGR
jgi:aspartate 1-decarboxylase